MSRRALTLVLVALPLAGCPPGVAAQSNVGCTAQLSPTAMAFGNIIPQVPSGTTRLLGDVVVRCTNGRNNPPNSINVSIGMSAGSSGSVAQRQMRSTGQGGAMSPIKTPPWTREAKSAAPAAATPPAATPKG